MPEVLSAHLGQSRPVRCWNAWVWSPKGTFSSQPTGRKILTQRRRSSPCWAPSIAWQSNTASLSLYACHPRGQEAAGAPSRDPPPPGPGPPALWAFTITTGCSWDALCVLSDSGTLPEESSFFRTHGLPFPAVSLRPSPSGPEALERGAFLLSGVRKEQVLPAVEAAISMAAKRPGRPGAGLSEDEKVSGKVAAILQSYATQDIRK